MDKRILTVIAVVLLGTAGFFVYRKFFFKHEGIRYDISPRGEIRVKDSIIFRDYTPGANRWVWDFGDGEFSTSQSGRHLFMSPGRFLVKLTVYGSFGALQDSGMVIDVIAAPRVAEASILGPATGEPGQLLNFATDVKAASYEWEVKGDPQAAAAKQTGSSASFTFRSPGSRTIVLTTHEPEQRLQKEVVVTAPQQVSAPVAAPVMPPVPSQATPRPAPKPTARPNRPPASDDEDEGGVIINEQRR